MRNQYLFPELESTAIELAILVGRLDQVEAEKKAANEDFKVTIDLLKMQIKQAARTINEAVAEQLPQATQKPGHGTASSAPGVPGFAPEPEGEAAH
jgi:hypothetical protein